MVANEEDVEELDPDTNEYALINSVDVLFETREWQVPEVRVLEDAQGNPLAFVALSEAIGCSRRRHGLPTEFFNHQLVELDYRDPYKLAAFMSEYGFLGKTLGGSSLSRNIVRALEELDETSRESIRAFEEHFGYMPNAYPSEGPVDWDGVFDHYYALKRAVARLDAKLEEAQSDSPLTARLGVCGLVSIKRAEYLYEDWLFAAAHIKALVQFHTPQELAAALGEDEYCVVRNCLNATRIVQRHLVEVHPVLGVLDVTEGQAMMAHDGGSLGSFEEALALQLWNFTLEAKGGFRLCKECGQVFVHKQGKSRSGASRSSSQFCCDRCKNRYAQREHRKTEGYRLKQQRKGTGG